MADYDEEFEQVDAGSSSTYPTSAGSIKKNGFMVINGRPCKVVDYSTAKTGKHGHAKASITGIDIFNGKKYEDSLPTSHNVEVPNIKRTEWQVMSVDGDGYLTLMDDKGNIRSDLTLPNETENDEVVAERIKTALDGGRECFVTILSAMDIEKVAEVAKEI
jgi:translation initiation factor 5A